MPITVRCPDCSAKLNAPDDAVGKTIRCPRCGSTTTVPVPADAPPPPAEILDDPPPPPRKPARPTRPAADDDDFDAPPRKSGSNKGRVAALVAVGVLLLGGVGFAVYWFGRVEKEQDRVEQKGGEVAAAIPGVKGGGLTPGRRAIATRWNGVVSNNFGFQVQLPWHDRPSESPYYGPLPKVVERATEATADSYSGTVRYGFALYAARFRPGSLPDQREKAEGEFFTAAVLLPKGSAWSAPKAVTWGGRPANEQTAPGTSYGGTGRTVARHLHTETGIYVGVVRDGGELAAAEVAYFFDSFALGPMTNPPAPGKPPPPKLPPGEIPSDWPWHGFEDDAWRVAFPAVPLRAAPIDSILKASGLTGQIMTAAAGGATYHAGTFRYPAGVSDDAKEQARTRVATALGIGPRPQTPEAVEAGGFKWVEYARRTGGTPAWAFVRFREVGDAVHVVAAVGRITAPPPEWERFAASYRLRNKK